MDSMSLFLSSVAPALTGDDEINARAVVRPSLSTTLRRVLPEATSLQPEGVSTVVRPPSRPRSSSTSLRGRPTVRSSSCSASSRKVRNSTAAHRHAE